MNATQTTQPLPVFRIAATSTSDVATMPLLPPAILTAITNRSLSFASFDVTRPLPILK